MGFPNSINSLLQTMTGNAGTNWIIPTPVINCSCSNTNAIISENGNIYFAAPGNCIITATFTDDFNPYFFTTGIPIELAVTILGVPLPEYIISLPIPVDAVIAQCVNNVNAQLLTQLQAANSNIRQLNFMFGHPIELKNTLLEMGESQTEKYLKFPVVMLFSDIITSPSSVKGAYGDVNLNIVIAMSTEANYTASQRSANNFVPILRPIYAALIMAIASCGYFWVQSPRQLLGRSIERFFWGKKAISGNATENEFDDFIDAIEIKNLKLTLSKKGAATALLNNSQPIGK